MVVHFFSVILSYFDDLWQVFHFYANCSYIFYMRQRNYMRAVYAFEVVLSGKYFLHLAYCKVGQIGIEWQKYSNKVSIALYSDDMRIKTEYSCSVGNVIEEKIFVISNR